MRLLLITTALGLAACTAPAPICDREAQQWDKFHTVQDECEQPAAWGHQGSTRVNEGGGSMRPPAKPETPERPEHPGKPDDKPGKPGKPGGGSDKPEKPSKPKPEKPGKDKPSKPEKPGKDKPSKPEKPKGNASANNGKGGNYDKTGHDDNGKGQGRNKK